MNHRPSGLQLRRRHPLHQSLKAPEPQQEGENQAEVNVADAATEEEADRVLAASAKRPLREEPGRLFP